MNNLPCRRECSCDDSGRIFATIVGEDVQYYIASLDDNHKSKRDHGLWNATRIGHDAEEEGDHTRKNRWGDIEQLCLRDRSESIDRQLGRRLDQYVKLRTYVKPRLAITVGW